jgi:hypothetical protein
MFAVIQEDEVIDYFKTKEEAEYEAFNQFEGKRSATLYKLFLTMTEQNIILAVIGMVGLFATATIWQRANRITTNYYKANKRFN